MSLLPSLPATSRLSDLFAQFPDHARPLLVHTEGVMNAGTPLPTQTCELIAAYVSGLNACAFCLGSHTRYAEALGVAPQVIDALIADLDTAPVEPTLRPLLSYVRKLTTLPSRLTQADADAVFAAGWDQAALYHAIQVCALFNLLNRLVEGSGVNYDYADDAATPSDLSADYIGFADRLGL